ncbi:hypothetical protein ACJQWK_06778 [Exserohilum turcicum]
MFFGTTSKTPPPPRREAKGRLFQHTHISTFLSAILPDTQDFLQDSIDNEVLACSRHVPVMARSFFFLSACVNSTPRNGCHCRSFNRPLLPLQRNTAMYNLVVPLAAQGIHLDTTLHQSQ